MKISKQQQQWQQQQKQQRVSHYKVKWAVELTDRISKWRNKLTPRQLSNKIEDYLDWFEDKAEGWGFDECEMAELISHIRTELESKFCGAIYLSNQQQNI